MPGFEEGRGVPGMEWQRTGLGRRPTSFQGRNPATQATFPEQRDSCPRVCFPSLGSKCRQLNSTYTRYQFWHSLDQNVPTAHTSPFCHCSGLGGCHLSPTFLPPPHRWCHRLAVLAAGAHTAARDPSTLTETTPVFWSELLSDSWPPGHQRPLGPCPPSTGARSFSRVPSDPSSALGSPPGRLPHHLHAFIPPKSPSPQEGWSPYGHLMATDHRPVGHTLPAPQPLSSPRATCPSFLLTFLTLGLSPAPRTSDAPGQERRLVHALTYPEAQMAHAHRVPGICPQCKRACVEVGSSWEAENRGGRAHSSPLPPRCTQRR